MEADNEKGAWLVWVWLLHNAPEQRQGFSREQVTCLESFRCCKYAESWITQLFHSNVEYKIVATSLHCRKCKSIIFFRMQPFVWTANCTMLKSYFELLCTSLTLVDPTGKSPPSVNYTLLCTGITTLNHKEYKIMNVKGYGTTMIKIADELSWNFNWKVFTAEQMFTRLT